MTTQYTDTQLLIGGQWVDAIDGRTLPVLNPATGQAIGRVARADTADLDRALEAAQHGFDAWRVLPAHDRALTMRRAAGLLRERADSIAALLTQEQGKPVSEAKGELLSSIELIEWFADEARRVYGRIIPSRDPNAQEMVQKEAVGPVAAFTPWNFPVAQVARKVSAALASGCSILVKAAEETPASSAALMKTFVDAGVPAGAVGLVYGDPAQISSYLVPHPVIRKVTFTGSTPVGKQLASLAGAHMKRVTMELGGHAPVVVAADADIALAVRTIGAFKFRNAGQVCISPTRFLVHEDVQDGFVKEMVRYAEGLKLGNGLEPTTTLGPLANPRRAAAMIKFVEDARAKGARIVTGGERVTGDGNYFTPTVMTDVPLEADVFNTEPFGPIASIRTFTALEDAVAEANRLSFGLAGYAFTSSLKTAHALGQRMKVGMLWVNRSAAPWPEIPFGGVKDSGYGSEGGPEALEAYLINKVVSIGMN